MALPSGRASCGEYGMEDNGLVKETVDAYRCIHCGGLFTDPTQHDSSLCWNRAMKRKSLNHFLDGWYRLDCGSGNAEYYHPVSFSDSGLLHGFKATRIHSDGVGLIRYSCSVEMWPTNHWVRMTEDDFRKEISGYLDRIIEQSE